jgi:hypothetical protein
MAATERRNIAVFDCETWGRNPRRCELVQLAAVVLDGDTLAPLSGGEFVSYVKPADWNNYSPDPEAIQLDRDHAQEVLEDQGAGPEGRSGRRSTPFASSSGSRGPGSGDTSHRGRQEHPALRPAHCGPGEPWPSGCASKDGLNKFFDRKMVVDLEDVLWYWFQGRAEQPPSFKMDDLRTYLGMDQADHHEALMDARQEALVIKKFLLLHRRVNVKFQGALAGATL